MRKFFTKKRIIWTVIIVLIVGFIASRVIGGNNAAAGILTEITKKQDIKQTVLATGQVVSTTDLELAFKASGFVEQINVKEGDKVKAGQILAALSNRDQLASLTQARGSLAQAQANYERVISGASGEDVAVSQVAYDNAKSNLEETKRQQKVLVDNAYKALMNSGLAAIASAANTGSVTVSITGAYNAVEQGQYKITIYVSGSGLRFQYNGLETGSGEVNSAPQPLGTKGLYIQFSSTSVPGTDSWTVTLPNTQSTSYVTNYNAYQAALETQRTSTASAENSVAAAKAALDLKKAQARPADVQAAQAQILSAQGQVLAAQSGLENTIIRAPASGTITQINSKKGEQASALQAVMVLQDVGNLHVESNVSEANIAYLKEGQAVDITFDSLGPDRHFKGQIQTVNPASNLVSGVVNYKVTVSMENIAEVKPGMTANLAVQIEEKKAVLAVPSRALLSRDGKKFVRVVTDTAKKTYDEKEVTIGLEADGGLVEIVSGLDEGTEVVTFIKK